MYEDVPRFDELPDGIAKYLNPPNIEVMITGVMMAKQTKSGNITVTYTDGTTEQRASKKDIDSEFSSFFSVVSFVQDGRR